MPEVAAWQWYFNEGHPGMSTEKPVLATGLRWFDNWYAVADLGSGAYAIGEPHYGQCNFSYLVVGSDRALLFDTGPGVRDIAPVVHSLTNLPVIALPSHLHFDHVGDLGSFTDIALPDLPALRAQAPGGVFSFGFYQFLGFVEGFQRQDLKVKRWIAPDSDIDLGGKTLRMLNVPGHTPDSVVLFDAAANRVFAGDFIYPSSIYAFLPGANLAHYATSAGRLAALLDDQSAVYGAHGCDKLPAVDVPRLDKADVVALGKAVDLAARGKPPGAEGLYPRVSPINERMKLLAKYPWMSH
jgi:glyoxylase-like metal-dependent hydrolase (beta-lactamase superfamily II)